MPDDTKAADMYLALLDFDVANGGGSKYMRVQRAFRQGMKRAREEIDSE